MHFLSFTCVATLATFASASPVSVEIAKRQGLVGGLLGVLGVDSVLNTLGLSTAGVSTNVSNTVNLILGGKPSTTPSNSAQALTLLNNIAKQPNGYEPLRSTSYPKNGFTVDNLLNYPTTTSTGPDPNSSNNVNSRNPSTSVFPKKSSGDAPYDLTEAQLRQVIYIPPSFTYGNKPPMILVPGTGSTGYLTFAANFIKLFSNVQYADPVWLNIPGYLLGDAQVHAEYVAYAINYISGISNNRNVSVMAWSQGNLDTQWAFKYWPSTRSIVSNFISFSPDFHGTTLANVICPGLAPLVCTPAILQQTYNSNFVQKLRANGGDSAYVPTTTIYSSFDEIVQPQSGTGASAYINDARKVGVTNAWVQDVCSGQPGAGLYTHEGILYHPISYGLAVDALTKGGPGSISRIDRTSLCGMITAPGLGLVELLATEGTIPIAGASILLYPSKSAIEPPIKSYAQ